MPVTCIVFTRGFACFRSSTSYAAIICIGLSNSATMLGSGGLDEGESDVGGVSSWIFDNRVIAILCISCSSSCSSARMFLHAFCTDLIRASGTGDSSSDVKPMSVNVISFTERSSDDVVSTLLLMYGR